MDSGTALMARDLKDALHLRIEGNTVYPPSASPSSLSSEASVRYVTTQPASPVTVRCAIGFMHQVKVSLTAVPAHQKLVVTQKKL